MRKPVSFYLALTAAVDDFNRRHHLDRGHLADAIGLRGPNARIQLSTLLNHNSERALNDAQRERLLHALDDPARRVFFDARVREYGYRLEPMETAPVRIDPGDLADQAMLEAADVFHAMKDALTDDHLDVDELRRIRKEAIEARDKYEDVIRMADREIGAATGGASCMG